MIANRQCRIAALIATVLLVVVSTGITLAAPFPVTITDDLGRAVTFAAPAKRIISLVPSNTEILYALKQEGKVVGVDSYSNYPPAVREKEKVGTPKAPALERIVALRPDLVLVGGISDKGLVQQLERLRIPVLGFAPETLAGVYSTVQKIGLACDAEATAESLVSNMKKQVAAVTSTVAKAKVKPLVLVEIWPDPLYSAGPGSFLDELITLAGGRNIAHDTKAAWPVLSLETVVARNPDVIITTQPMSNSIATKFPKVVANVKAVQSGRVALIDQDASSRPGPRLIDALQSIAKALHPELF